MKENTKEEFLQIIEIIRESVKNSMEIYLESYTEVLSRLDYMTHLIINSNKK